MKDSDLLTDLVTPFTPRIITSRLMRETTVTDHITEHRESATRILHITIIIHITTPALNIIGNSPHPLHRANLTQMSIHPLLINAEMDKPNSKSNERTHQKNKQYRFHKFIPTDHYFINNRVPRRQVSQAPSAV